ncbi:MAG: ribonuclease H-like domain-containing protein [Haloarculaceae archaeon]
MRLENSFIGVRGVGEKTERRLWSAGVTHWDEFDPDLVGPTQADRIETFIDRAWTALDDADADFFADALPGGERWRLYENFRDRATFFDIETTGLSEERDDVTTVSFHRDGETTTLIRGEDLTRDRLAAQFADASVLVTFNGARFDVPFLETSFDLDVTTPHIDLMYPCRRLGLSGGLKPIEKAVGIDRDRPDLSGRDAVRLWQQYERSDDRDALETLVQYNREDTVNLRRLMDHVADRLHEDVFVAACDGT